MTTSATTAPAIRFRLPGFIKTSISLFIFLTLFLVTIQLTAQYEYTIDKTTRFDKLGIEEGLTTDLTRCIHQDKYGFIWIGTWYGLNLYDGYQVKTFNSDPNNPLALLSENISNIFEEADGTLWFCTRYGISRYNRENQTFSNYLQDTLYSNKNYTTQKILQLGDYFWVDVDKGLFRFNKKTGKFKSFGKDTLDPKKGIYGINSNYIFLDNSGTLWVSSNEPYKEVVLCRFNKEDETFTYFKNEPNMPESFVGKEVKSMIEDRDGTLWIATLGGGLFEVIDRENGKFRQYLATDAAANFRMNKRLRTVFEDSKGNIWTGGRNGFSLFNKKTGSFKNYPIPRRKYNLNWTNKIVDFVEDEKGRLYLTVWEGLFVLNPSSQQLLHYLKDPENQNSLSSNNLNHKDLVIIDHAGHPWIASLTGVNTINPFANEFRRAQKKSHIPGSLSDNTVSDIFIDSKDNLWIGNHAEEGGGLNKTTMNPQRDFNNFAHFMFDENDPKTIASNWINSIYEDKDETIWIGANGLNRFDPATKGFIRFQYDPDDSTTINSNSLRSILEDSYGTFWVGTKNGLNMMNKETGKCIRFLPDINDKNSTYGKGVYKIL